MDQVLNSESTHRADGWSKKEQLFHRTSIKDYAAYNSIKKMKLWARNETTEDVATSPRQYSIKEDSIGS